MRLLRAVRIAFAPLSRKNNFSPVRSRPLSARVIFIARASLPGPAERKTRAEAFLPAVPVGSCADFQHDLSARVAALAQLPGVTRTREWENFSHRRLDLAGIEQLAKLAQSLAARLHAHHLCTHVV